MPLSVRSIATNAPVVVLTVCAVIMTAGVIRREHSQSPFGSGPTQSAKPEPVADWSALSSVGHRIGPQNAAVTIVEFGDFECPACGQFARQVLKGIRAKYPLDLALVFRHWPLPYHRFAYPAARAAECAAEQGRFGEFFDSLYARQDSLGLKSFHQFAAASGVADLPRFDRCNASAGLVPAIEADIAAAHALKGRGTPTLVINGLRLGSIPDSADLDDMVRTEISKVRSR